MRFYKVDDVTMGVEATWPARVSFRLPCVRSNELGPNRALLVHPPLVAVSSLFVGAGVDLARLARHLTAAAADGPGVVGKLLAAADGPQLRRVVSRFAVAA